MKKVTFAILGMGNRGTRYAQELIRYPEEAEVAAIADTRQVRLDSANKFLNLPEERLFDSAEAILAAPQLADVMIIATQDGQHKEHAIAAMERGYHLILEKPISNKREDCIEIAEIARKYDRTVIVCHVLRYTGFYREIKKLIDQGLIGDVMNIHALEMVGYYHFAHSFVRGNWHKEATTSPMILAKCCHDMDLMLWLSGKHCEAVSSVGELTHFRTENCPEGAKERCTDGCTVDCPYHAPTFYLSRMPGWPTNILHPEPTEEIVMELLRTGDYGRCVYKMDNDVADHQSVTLRMEDGVTVSFTVSAFNAIQDREINIMGTKGQIWGSFRTKKFQVGIYGQEPYEVDLTALYPETGGHGGGDAGLVRDAIRLFRGDEFDQSSITSIDRSVESHLVAFAAEESRRLGGALIEL